MAVEITSSYQGQLRCKSVHGPSGIELFTDAPVDNCGKGESFSPTDLVATALGSCMLTIIGIVGERNEINLDGFEAKVIKHMSTDTVRRIQRLEVQLSGPAACSESERKKLVNAAFSCPVHKTIESSVEIEVSFNWCK